MNNLIKYTCKPSLYNNKGMKVFYDAQDAVRYLNETLAFKDGDHPDYVYIAPDMSNINNALEDYMFMGKLSIDWDL